MFQSPRYKWLKHIFTLVLIIFIFLEFPYAFARGQTSGWTTPINFSEQPDTYSNVPNILCDPYQNLHVFWGERLDLDGAPLSILFYRNDVGGVWSKPLDLLITDRFEDLHAAITPDDLVHLVWTNNAHNLMYFRAPLSATTQVRQWGKPVVLASNAYYSNVSVDKNGIIYVIYTTDDIDALKNGIYYISSADSGNTWSLSQTIMEIDTPIPSSATAQLVVDGMGRFHVVYNVRSYTYGEYSILGYLRSLDAGQNWDFPLTFPSGTTFQGVAMIAAYTFANDEIHLTYDIPDRLHQWSYSGGDTWSAPIPIVNGVDVGAAFGGYNQLVKDGAGVMHVVFAERRGVFHSTWDGANWNVAELIGQPVFDPHYQTMAICQGNRLSVLYGGNDIKSEIWYSEKILDIQGIPQSPIPSPTTAPPPTPRASENIVPLYDTPIPTKIVASPPQIQEQRSILSPLILPVVLVLFLISIALVYRGIKR